MIDFLRILFYKLGKVTGVEVDWERLKLQAIPVPVVVPKLVGLDSLSVRRDWLVHPEVQSRMAIAFVLVNQRRIGSLVPQIALTIL